MAEFYETPAGLHQRALEGSVLYSHTVVARPGDLVFVSGQLSRNADGDVVAADDMAGQIRQVVKNLEAALAAAGATLADLVQTVTYTTEIDLYFEHIKTRMELFGALNLPTSTTIGVSRLSNPAFMVEVNGIAVLREPR